MEKEEKEKEEEKGIKQDEPESRIRGVGGQKKQETKNEQEW